MKMAPLRLATPRLNSGTTMNIVITGAASGIGEGLVQHLSALGHHIIATDISENALAALRQKYPSVSTQLIDVTQPEHIAALLTSHARIDVLINNAGVQHVARLEQFPIERWSQLVDILLTGAARMTQAVLPLMRQQAFGRIINIGSIHSIVASPYKSAYVAAKHGLLGLSKVIALETADTDITINTVCPTYVKTPLVDQQIAATAREYNMSESQVVAEIMLKPMPKSVFISMEELAGICAFLMSPAARNITGQSIIVDGGWTAR